MALITNNQHGMVFVLDVRKLVGTLSDGDIRRALLKGEEIGNCVTVAMNKDFVSLPHYSRDIEIRNHLISGIKLIPLCDDCGNLVDVADIYSNHRVPFLEPDLSGNEMNYVVDCMKTNWISSQGSYVTKFEKQFEHMHQGMKALAVSNGTVALHLALATLGIGTGDEVIVPDLTFAATINAVLYCNATPVLCDIDPASFCIDLQKAKKLIGPKTKAIIPVHLYGQPCAMDEVKHLASEFGLLIIEDCAEALGSSWNDKLVGTFGDASTFSFFGNKTISTGEGGMVLYSDPEKYSLARRLRDHGMSREKKYWHEDVGFNYRLTNLQAAVGVAQMERFEHIFKRKQKIVSTYDFNFKSIKEIISFPKSNLKNNVSHWLYTIILDAEIDRDSVMSELLKEGIDTRPVFYPLHSMPPYQKFIKSQIFLNSKKISYSGISLPTSITMTEEQQMYVIEKFKYVLNKVKKGR